MTKLYELFAGLPVRIDGPDVDVTALACDSRRVVAGACFAALPGARADGHAFVTQALERGAASVLCERLVEHGRATEVLAANTRLVLAQAARRFFGDPSRALCMIGITGTKGKTTTSYLVEAVLAAAGRTPGVVGTLGYRYLAQHASTGLTTPESVDLVALLAKMVAADVQAVAMEVSSHALAQQRVSGVDFDVAVFTNLALDHLDYHGTMDAYFEAKRLLFTARRKAGGKVVTNIDDAYGARLFGGGAIGYSAAGAAAADVATATLHLGTSDTELSVRTPRGLLELRSPLVGRFNVDNILAAVAVGEALGLPHAAVARGVAALRAVPGRLERVSERGEPVVIVDYAHTPDSLEKVLAAVRAFTRGRLLCVFGCGGDRDTSKRARMGEIVARAVDWAVLTNDNPRSEPPEAIAAAVEQGLRAGGAAPSARPNKGGYRVELDRALAIRLAVGAAELDDAVVVAGKGHETYQIIGSETRHFDDREEARAALAERRRGALPRGSEAI